MASILNKFKIINNISTKEKVDLNDGDDLKQEIRKNFKVSSSIIDNFIENTILVDIEKEEYYFYHLTNFIYKVEKSKIKNYSFYLFRQINEQILFNKFNIKYNALFIIFNLEKNFSEDLIVKLTGIIEKMEEDIKIYILGYYDPENNKIITEEKIKNSFVTEKNEPIEYKYKEIELNKEKQSQLSEVNKYIEALLKDIYKEEKDNNRIVGMRNIDENADSRCILI